MRPRPDAAENPGGCPPTPAPPRRFNEAAARCRGKPLLDLFNRAPNPHASMRPRPDAAENQVNPDPTLTVPEQGFNEAAARCRGKPASTHGGHHDCTGFNEAAARCRGKPRTAAPKLPKLGRLQ